MSEHDDEILEDVEVFQFGDDSAELAVQPFDHTVVGGGGPVGLAIVDPFSHLNAEHVVAHEVLVRRIDDGLDPLHVVLKKIQRALEGVVRTPKAY